MALLPQELRHHVRKGICDRAVAVRNIAEEVFCHRIFHSSSLLGRICYYWKDKLGYGKRNGSLRSVSPAHIVAAVGSYLSLVIAFFRAPLVIDIQFFNLFIFVSSYNKYVEYCPTHPNLGGKYVDTII